MVSTTLPMPNSAATAVTPRIPISRLASPSRIIRRIAPVRLTRSSGRTTSPHECSRTKSASPQVSVTTTGRPAASASITIIPNGSSTAGSTRNEQRSRRGLTASRSRGSSTDMPLGVPDASSSLRNGESSPSSGPTITNRASTRSRRRSMAASANNRGRFLMCSREQNKTSGTSSSNFGSSRSFLTFNPFWRKSHGIRRRPIKDRISVISPGDSTNTWDA